MGVPSKERKAIEYQEAGRDRLAIRIVVTWHLGPVRRGTSKLFKIPSQGTGQRVTGELVVFALTQVRRKATILPWAGWGHLTLAIMLSHTHTVNPCSIHPQNPSVYRETTVIQTHAQQTQSLEEACYYTK